VTGFLATIDTRPVNEPGNQYQEICFCALHTYRGLNNNSPWFVSSCDAVGQQTIRWLCVTACSIESLQWYKVPFFYAEL